VWLRVGSAINRIEGRLVLLANESGTINCNTNLLGSIKVYDENNVILSEQETIQSKTSYELNLMLEFNKTSKRKVEFTISGGNPISLGYDEFKRVAISYLESVEEEELQKAKQLFESKGLIKSQEQSNEYPTIIFNEKCKITEKSVTTVPTSNCFRVNKPMKVNIYNSQEEYTRREPKNIAPIFLNFQKYNRSITIPYYGDNNFQDERQIQKSFTANTIDIAGYQANSLLFTKIFELTDKQGKTNIYKNCRNYKYPTVKDYNLICQDRVDKYVMIENKLETAIDLNYVDTEQYFTQTDPQSKGW
jgi:hypothetical protein